MRNKFLATVAVLSLIFAVPVAMANPGGGGHGGGGHPGGIGGGGHFGGVGHGFGGGMGGHGGGHGWGGHGYWGPGGWVADPCYIWNGYQWIYNCFR